AQDVLAPDAAAHESDLHGDAIIRRRVPRRSAAEPAGAATRAEVLLLGDEGARRLAQRPRRPRAGEEGDVDPADAASTELDVAGAASLVAARLVLPTGSRDERAGDDTRLALREHARLRHADPRDVADRVHVREACRERAGLHRDVPVLRHPALEHDLR